MAGRKKKTTHSSGMYRKRITLGRDEFGNPIVKAVYADTKEELENKIAQLRIDKGMGVAVTDNKSTWKYWSDTWSKLNLPPLGKTTQDMYRAAIKHLSPLNDKKVSKLTSLDLSIIVNEMGKTGYAKRTINSVISTAHQICRLARKNRAMMFDISEDVRPPVESPVEEREQLTDEEINALWGVRPLPYKPNSIVDKKRAERLPLIRMLALMQLKCGIRREEAVPLKWENIDLENRILTIKEAFDFKGKRIKDTKSKAGERQIPIPLKYEKELEVWKNSNKGTLQGRKYVFPGSRGIIQDYEFQRLWDVLLDAMSGITVSDRISAGKKKSGIIPNTTRRYEFTSHQLRHTFATDCIARGIDVRTVQYFMGHATAEMTLKYAHKSNAAFESARKILDNADNKSQKKKNKA